MGQGGREERRGGTRLKKMSLVQVSRFDEEGFRADLATGRTLDISRGGIRLELHHPLPLRSKVRLDLVFGERLVHVGGTIVYLEAVDEDTCCMGIAFEDMDPETESLLAELLAEKEADSRRSISSTGAEVESEPG